MTAQTPSRSRFAAGAGWIGRFASRLETVGQLFRHFSRRGRLFMLPLLLLVMISALLLIVAGGLSYVAPFVYAIF